VDRALAVLLLVAAIFAPVAVDLLHGRMDSEANPLFGAALSAVEGGPDERATARLEAARRATPADRDLARSLGRLEEAIAATAKEGESAHAFLDTATRLAARLGPPPGARPGPSLIVEP